MKCPGLIGGVGPESTVEYYRFLIECYRKEVPDGSYPSLIINSIDMTRMLDGIGAGRLAETVDYLSGEIEKLAAAGADFAALASNTPHIVFEELKERSRIPLVSIVEAACREAKAKGIRKAALFGTAYTMQGGFYQRVFEKAGIKLLVPEAEEQRYIHEKYMGELVKGIIRDETRAGLATIARKMKTDRRAEALVLGGTELPLILRDAPEIGMPIFDTTKIHVAEIMRLMLERRET